MNSELVGRRYISVREYRLTRRRLVSTDSSRRARTVLNYVFCTASSLPVPYVGTLTLGATLHLQLLLLGDDTMSTVLPSIVGSLTKVGRQHVLRVFKVDDRQLVKYRIPIMNRL
jgi:hypothetical protein